MRISDWSSDVCSSDLWNIKDLKQFTFQLDDPGLTLREVAESAMRASVAEQELDSVVSGAGRAEVEGRVQRRMQAVLDAYRSGIAIQGVAVERADPPTKVIEAFKAVSAAEQESDALRNRARAYEIGRGSGRERVCQYVWISVVDGSIKK